MYVDNSWLSLNPIYLSLLHPYKRKKITSLLYRNKRAIYLPLFVIAGSPLFLSESVDKK